MAVYHLYIGDKTYSSWSLRPWLLLKTLQIPFVECLHAFGDITTRHARYRTFSPTGKVPCLMHHDQVIWDSLAIIEYLAEQHKNVYPSELTARAWSRCAIAEMHAGFQSLRQHCPMDCTRHAALEEIPEAVQVDLERLERLWQQGMDQFGGPFLAGQQFSAVDAYYAPVALRIHQYQLPINANSQAWVTRIIQLDAMQQWLKDAALEQSH